jgi:hypothetical protein
MKNRGGIGVVAALAACLLAAQPVASPPRDERDVEKLFAAEIRAENIREYDRRLSAEPHAVGSARGEENARWMLARFREW